MARMMICNVIYRFYRGSPLLGAKRVRDTVLHCTEPATVLCCTSPALVLGDCFLSSSSSSPTTSITSTRVTVRHGISHLSSNAPHIL